MVLGWKRPGRVGRRRIPLGAVASCCRAFHIEIESRSDSISFFVRSNAFFPSPRKLHRIAAQFACGVPPLALAAALFTSKSSREATRFLSLFEAKLSSHPPQIAPDSGAICFVCVCLRHNIELVWVFGEMRLDNVDFRLPVPTKIPRLPDLEGAAEYFLVNREFLAVLLR